MNNTRGNSLMEFAVVTAMMAILAATAGPKLSMLSEGAKASKSMSELDKIARYHDQVEVINKYFKK